jgi:ketosteroid isomerase-like protein
MREQKKGPTRRGFGLLAAGASISVALATPTGATTADVAERAAQLATVRAFFDLMHRKEIEAWGELLASDGRILVPYPPEGFGTSVDSKAAILSAFRQLFAGFETFDATLTGIYPAADSDAICVEYAVRAVMIGGAEYTNTNIAVFRFEAALIKTYHDYFDPRRFQAVVDALKRR